MSDKGQQTVAGILSKLDAVVGAILKAALIFVGLALAFLMVTQIVLRYWLMLPFLGIEEISVLLGLWLYFLGAALVTRENTHIKGGMADLVIKNPVVLEAVRFGGTLICLASSCFFAYIAVGYAQFMMSTNRTSAYLQWPTSIWVISMAVGFVLVAVYFLVHSVRQWRQMRQPK